MNLYLEKPKLYINSKDNPSMVLFIMIVAGTICLSGSIGSFFVFKNNIYNCRDPPFINLNLKI